MNNVKLTERVFPRWVTDIQVIGDLVKGIERTSAFIKIDFQLI